jgi:hypothetical protein
MMVAQKANFDNNFWKVAWKGNMKLMNELWRHKKNVMATKVMKTKGFPKYTKTKKNYETKGLKFKSKHKTMKIKNKNMK